MNLLKIQFFIRIGYIPVLISYTFLAYKIFHGKAKDLSYE